MAYDPQRHHRRSIRLRNFDYASPGGYFVTICVQHMAALFGHIADGAMHLNDAGNMVRDIWLDLPTRFANLQLDEHVVMPNHFHGILILTSAPDDSARAALVGAPPLEVEAPSLLEEGTATRAAPTDTESPIMTQPPPARPTLFDIVGAFKSITTDAYIAGVKQHGWPRFDRRLWHRNYYEHIVRDEAGLARIRSYIRYNPVNWNHADLNPT